MATIDAAGQLGPAQDPEAGAAPRAAATAAPVAIGDDARLGDPTPGETTACGVLIATVRDFKLEHPDFEAIVHGRVA